MSDLAKICMECERDCTDHGIVVFNEGTSEIEVVGYLCTEGDCRYNDGSPCIQCGEDVLCGGVMVLIPGEGFVCGQGCANENARGIAPHVNKDAGRDMPHTDALVTELKVMNMLIMTAMTAGFAATLDFNEASVAVEKMGTAMRHIKEGGDYVT